MAKEQTELQGEQRRNAAKLAEKLKEVDTEAKKVREQEAKLRKKMQSQVPFFTCHSPHENAREAYLYFRSLRLMDSQDPY